MLQYRLQIIMRQYYKISEMSFSKIYRYVRKAVSNICHIDDLLRIIYYLVYLTADAVYEIRTA